MKKAHWFLLVIVLLLIVGSFYWFELRPSNIRSSCQAKATQEATTSCRNVNTGRENGGLEPCIAKFSTDIYYRCVHEGGLK